MKRLIVAIVLALMPAAAHAQQTEEQARRAASAARRDSLEAEIVQKFVQRLSRDLSLDASQRAQTERVLRESGAHRRELSRASSALRGRIYRTARDKSATEADFIRLLAEHESLRAREHDLWRRDQEELARFLNPRQRALFLLSWAHFQDDMRDILSRRMRDQGDSRDRHSDGNARPPGGS
jgi:hypothetical protein